jgi:flagellar hook-associated protein 1 FlgK
VRSTFFGIELGKRGLMTHQAGTDITGHNVTNATTPGFSRQSPNIVSTSPLWMPGVNPVGVAAQLGTGSAAIEVKRAENLLLNVQIRTNLALEGRITQFESAYTQIENIFVQPDEGGLDVLLTNFFASWHALSLAPEEDANRVAVREAAETIIREFHRITDTLNQYRELVNDSVLREVDRVNEIAEQIAKLNNEIARVVGTGQTPNDLMDQRDRYLDELASLVPLQVKRRFNESTIITVEGRVLVEDQEVRPLLAKRNWDNTGFYDVLWSDRPSVAVEPDTGAIGALQYTRDQLVPAFQDELDLLASTLIEEVNAIHTRTVDGVPVGYGLDGLTGRDFFVGSDAGSIDLSDPIKRSTRTIQAAEEPVAGDGLNALAIAELRWSRPLGAGTLTFDGYFQAVMADLGAASDSINRSLETQTKLMTQLEGLKEQEVGVNLDEEFINLIRYEQGYNAAGRLVSTVDDMLDRLINGTGRVGL